MIKEQNENGSKKLNTLAEGISASPLNKVIINNLSGNFNDVIKGLSASNLPKIPLSILDLESNNQSKNSEKK